MLTIEECAVYSRYCAGCIFFDAVVKKGRTGYKTDVLGVKRMNLDLGVKKWTKSIFFLDLGNAIIIEFVVKSYMTPDHSECP